jgi:hypothetical protein
VFCGLLAESDEVFHEQDVTAEHDRMKISPFTIVVIIGLFLRYGGILYRVLCKILKGTYTTSAFRASFLKL